MTSITSADHNWMVVKYFMNDRVPSLIDTLDEAEYVNAFNNGETIGIEEQLIAIFLEVENDWEVEE